jgi:hypothetical protein
MTPISQEQSPAASASLGSALSLGLPTLAPGLSTDEALAILAHPDTPQAVKDATGLVLWFMFDPANKAWESMRPEASSAVAADVSNAFSLLRGYIHAVVHTESATGASGCFGSLQADCAQTRLPSDRPALENSPVGDSDVENKPQG